jgi:hypothetical protein
MSSKFTKNDFIDKSIIKHGNEFCYKKNIKLIRIPYYESDFKKIFIR